MRRARWIYGLAHERKSDIDTEAVLFDSDTDGEGLALAGERGPTVILSFGRWSLHLIGAETLEELRSAIDYAYIDDAEAKRKMGIG